MRFSAKRFLAWEREQVQKGIPKVLREYALARGLNVGRQFDSSGKHAYYFLKIDGKIVAHRQSATGLLAYLKRHPVMSSGADPFHEKYGKNPRARKRTISPNALWLAVADAEMQGDQALARRLRIKARAAESRAQAKQKPRRHRSTSSGVKNPRAPKRTRGMVEKASRLFESFTGQPAGTVKKVAMPAMSGVALNIGKVTGIMYETVRDGKKEDYIHEFKASARPTFAVSHDGKRLYLLGGAYSFTSRGIVDKRR